MDLQKTASPFLMCDIMARRQPPTNQDTGSFQIPSFNLDISVLRIREISHLVYCIAVKAAQMVMVYTESISHQLCATRVVYQNTHSGFICNSSNIDTTQIPIKGIMDNCCCVCTINCYVAIETFI